MERIEIAGRLHAEGYNCAQSLLVAFGPRLGLTRAHALKLGAPLAGGLSRTGSTCGAALGAILVLGLSKGHTDPDNDDAIVNTRELTQEFLRRFADLTGGRTCPEVLGADMSLPGELDRAVAEELFEKSCPAAVRGAAAILIEMIDGTGENAQ